MIQLPHSWVFTQEKLKRRDMNRRGKGTATPTSQNAHSRPPETCGSVTFQGKRDFGVAKVTGFQVQKWSWIIQVGPIESHESLKAASPSSPWSQRDVETEGHSETRNVTGFEDGGRGPQAKACGEPLGTGGGRDTDSPLERDSALLTAGHASDLPDCQVIISVVLCH